MHTQSGAESLFDTVFKFARLLDDVTGETIMKLSIISAGLIVIVSMALDISNEAQAGYSVSSCGAGSSNPGQTTGTGTRTVRDRNGKVISVTPISCQTGKAIRTRQTSSSSSRDKAPSGSSGGNNQANEQ